jgi:hypothetical protein
MLVEKLINSLKQLQKDGGIFVNWVMFWMRIECGSGGREGKGGKMLD